MALRRMLASTSGGSASAWQVWPLKARRSVSFGGAVGSRYSAICAGVTAKPGKGDVAAKLACECLDVFQERQELRDAARIVVTNIDHFGRALVFGKRGREFVFVGEALETAAAHHRDAERMRDALELRHHTARLADHDQPCRLSDPMIERDALGHGADGRHELLGVLPVIGLGDDAGVVADDVHRDVVGAVAAAAGAVEMLDEALVRAVGLLVLVGTDEAIKDLP